MVKLNKIYIKEGSMVTPLNFSKTKTDSGFIDSIICKEVKRTGVNGIFYSFGERVVIPLEDFENTYFPESLEPGMRVQGVSMGKVIREYVVESVGNGRAVLKKTAGVSIAHDILMVNLKLSADGFVTAIDEEKTRECHYIGTAGVDFRLVTKAIERRQANKSVINTIVNKLKCGEIKVGKIDLDGNVEVAQGLLKLVEELEEEIEIRLTK